ncbi:type II toxin-antitoxin system PemK/MazF family toxin [bacterium]|nr:type II toxin-antitoxin system PemK/MazF family toxin [bacterium]
MTPPSLSRGDVVLTRFPFTDLTGASLRPALVISMGQIGQDIILAAISSVLRGTLVPTDYTVDTTHPEFAMTGLRVTSVFRIHKLATVERSVISRRLGRIGPRLQAEVDRLLRVVLAL